MAYRVKGESFSTSSNSTPKWKHDVFLSFAGKDTRLNFTDHLYSAFSQRGIRAFKDDKGIERGEVISQQLFQAIEDSLVAVVVFSQNYANAAWCLDELQKIIDCRNKLGQQVFPIFYGVDPSDVRHLRKSFALALAKHEERFKGSKDKLQKWKNALLEISNLSGWDTSGRPETQVIQDVVEAIWNKLCSKLPSYDDYNLVGMVSRIVEINSLLKIGLGEVLFVGIWGMGGIGKTTLARVVYENISDQFEICCFLADIRETSERKGKVYLQRELLSHVSNIKIKNEFEGKKEIRKYFWNKMVLLVLDDINHVSQLGNLAAIPEWFGEGSRVIITTRDKHLLTSHGVHGIYEIEPMKEDESLKIFSKEAFKKDHPEEGYVELSKSVVEYAGGLPLALQVLGSFLHGRSVLEWEDALDRLKQISDKDVFQILKISYDGLNDEEKALFLDIACFFKGWEKDEVIQILKNTGLHSSIGISILIEKALLVEHHTDFGTCRLEMHDLFQEMGRNIVYQESPSIACRRSRLWKIEDIDEVLENTIGTEAIQSIVLDSSQRDDPEVYWEPHAFSKLFNLRLLVIRRRLELPNGLKCLSSALRVIQWQFCPLEALPLGTPLNKLVDIEMQQSNIKQLWYGVQLVSVNLCGCTSLKVIPRKLETNSLEKLLLRRCSEVSMLPEFGEGMKTLSLLDVSYTAVRGLPQSFGFLTGLRDLKMRNCEHLVLRLSVFHHLKNLKTVDMCGCLKLSKGPKRLNEIVASEKHDMSENFRTDMTLFSAIVSNQVFSFNPSAITELDLSACGLSDGSIVEHFSGLSSLLVLNLGGNDFVILPDGWICSSIRLRFLFLSACRRLKSLPKLPPQLIRLDAVGCNSMEPLSERQLWNMVSSLHHEYRHQVKYENTLLKHIEVAEYFPQRDFFAIIRGSEIPSWFPNNDYVASDLYRSKCELVMNIPQHVRASEWSGLAVCIKLQIMPCVFDSFHISWSSKAPEDDHYVRKKWAHEIRVVEKEGPHICIMVLHLNEKTCWQHLRGHDNCLHIKFTFHSPSREMLKIGGCGWRVMCKEDLEEWRHNNYWNKSSTQEEIDDSEVRLPHTALDRTIKIFQ
ncbi:TMV resistance protein N-like isoform X2 [Prosopis cineraria]|nr:TMV resistance protein N-like isoform X2 [Prosopis cineraria]